MMRILIANRGEIARRIMRTAHRMGHETVAVFADPDADAPFVTDANHAVALHSAELAATYLSSDALLNAAAASGADAVHPGYGFLSENAEFARAVVSAGLVWIGPHADAIAQMGSKIESRHIAEAAGLPVISGFDASQDRETLRSAAAEIGYPVLIKAAAGGGGRGIRIVEEAAAFDEELAAAKSESLRSFGDDAVIVERYVQRPRHIEVQVMGDKLGGLIELGTRECSVQRRYQKILEEAPAPNLPPATRTGLRRAAVEFARHIGYDSAGTVEFVVDDLTGDYFFLEMNTRLQVEHPITEAVTGLDLVELMINSATGASLELTQEQIEITGHAVEVRINAEDVAADFAPQTGEITHLLVPEGVRWDSGVEVGSVISPYYDSMIAKLIVSGDDRAGALAGLRRALDGLVLGGLTTTTGLHRWLLDQEPIIDGRVTTRYLDEIDFPEPAARESAAALAARYGAPRIGPESGSTAWADIGPFRTTPHVPTRRLFLRDQEGVVHEIAAAAVAEEHPVAAVVDVGADSVAVNDAGVTHTFSLLTRSEAWAPASEVGHGHAAAIAAPFPALVAEVRVSPGDHVAGGDVVIVIEAMKALHSLPASGPGVVDAVRVRVGEQVESRQVLITFEVEP